ncbi:MAG: type II toxin-antitoxin system VapC family toxin [Trichlorobacter sp.]|uniref:type II toxin-antitoxin system VapC family toxin n=1 Tax=Trichlorobacter sp. TaxID=2911007 RepID=UPI002569B450|nr:type II toxin-antitoxin system VapC family toxin [Trichlorobacter sp.]MDK9719005.1 type II toxin-antitoxin system VapC family toxin [Trichlorobacter sp.]
MILYADTSSLVKLYVEEAGSDAVRELVRKADMVASCRVALPEMVSALTRRHHNRQIETPVYELLIQAVRNDWRRLVALEFDEQLAADLVQRHALRGYDAVHLASAVQLSNNDQVNMVFSSYDQQLMQAANDEGLVTTVNTLETK